MRTLVFWLAALFLLLLPVPALAAEPPADGRYRVEVTLTGGSGRAGVESPAELRLEAGAATAVVTWSSPYYEHMLVDGVYYYPVNTDGNAVFEIPVILDAAMAVSAQTIAMSAPHQIDYTLYFDSTTLRRSHGQSPAPLGKIGGFIAAAVLLFALWRRRRRGPKAAEGA